MQDSPETFAIRRRMDEVRCDLDEDVQEIVEGARGMANWRYYVKAYPWACLGAAIFAGYLIAPRRHYAFIPAPISGALPDQGFAAAPSAQPPPSASNSRGVLLGALGNLAMRAVVSYVERLADKPLATRGDKRSARDPS